MLPEPQEIGFAPTCPRCLTVQAAGARICADCHARLYLTTDEIETLRAVRR